MKSKFFLSLAMAIIFTVVYGQNPTITLTFTADENGQHVPLNSILIENLTREVDTTLYAPDTALVIDYLVGINENLSIGGDGFYLSQNYPNPFGGETTIDLFLPETENVLIIVSDMLGRELVNRNIRLDRGNHSFTFYPGTESLYFLTARSERHSQTIKMINTPHASSRANCALEYKGMKSGSEQYKSGNEKTSFVYYLGDQLKFTAFADNGERVISSSPSSDRTYHFNFTGISCPGTPTVTDIDGNVYNTVLIGEQCWMKENLKTTTYRNGTPIPNVTNADEWANLITGAYSWYGNLIEWKESYGALYNWHATVDQNELCPEGWHVPSWGSWTQLINFAVSQGYPNQWNDPNGAGNALKSCRQLDSPLGGGCNTTEHPRWSAHGTHHGFDAFGFSALPGGYRVANGLFAYLWGYGGWWSSTETIPISAWNHHMYHYEASVIMYSYFKEYGFSVRCLRDEIPPTTYQLNLEAAPSDAGILSGDGQYQAGEDVNISATANPGWEFVNWTDDNGIVSAEPNFTYTMPAQDITLTANFIEEQGGFNCGDTLVDPRDGQSYTTVQIGDQCWMAENLNIGTMINGNQEMTNNGIYEKYCFNNDEANCDIFGGLYQWNEMMQYSTTPGVKGICPEGWHLPTGAEWTALTTYVSSQPAYLCNSNTTYIAKALAATTNWAMHTGACTVGNNLTLNNATGFTALPGGYCHSDGSFGYLNSYGMWWSSSQYDDAKAWYQIMYFSGAHVHGDNYYKSNAYSVRCLRDDSPPPITYILNLEADPSDAGILSGDGQYEAGDYVNISATAIPGWQFLNWTDDDGIVSTAPNFIYTMPSQDITLTANFIEAQGGPNCGDLLIDARDGQSYATVQIGDQCWMAENLNIGIMIIGTQEMTDNGIIEKYCYDNDESNCDIYGGLYQWDEMMQYTIAPDVQGICPEGWHLPTDTEWTALTTYLGGESIAGGKLKEAGTAHWVSPNTGATNSSGFTALPGGGRSTEGSFLYKNQQGTWWSSAQYDVSNAWKRSLSYSNTYVYRFNNSKPYGFSVRCLKDDTIIPTYQLNLEAAPSNAGVISGAGQYQAGEDVNISATANPGWDFVNWTDDNGIISELESFTYTMPAQDITLTANFIEEQGGFNCGDTLIDSRDGQSYATVQIVTQCWMAENLNIGTMINGDQVMTDNGIVEKYCANNDEANCNIYGGLYQWDEMMDYTTTEGVQGICPEGWYLPTDDEWCILEKQVEPSITCLSTGYRGTIGGGKLKETGTSHWNAPNTGATNESGFTALPGSRRYSSGLIGAPGNHGGWWSSTENDFSGIHRILLYDLSQVGRFFGVKSIGFSVRCLKDGFVPNSYNLSLEADPTHAGIVSGAGQYIVGEEVNITANSNPGWKFTTWTDDDGIVSTEASFTYTMPAQDITLTAHFIDAYQLNLEAVPSNAGTVSGAGQYQAGEDANVSATANPGWEFVNWTDDDGIVSELASFTYTMPAQDITLTANFIVKTPTWQPCPGTPTVTDIDGNVYNTVLIGDQCWMNENLKTTHYQDGTPIEYPGDSASAWQYNANGAYAWYNNDLTWKDSYGALYNWHAVGNQNGLCPPGWYVPSDDDWTQLIDYVVDQGFPNIHPDPNGTGNALKSCRQVNSPLGDDCNTSEHPRWNSTNTQYGFDEFLFSALPGGRRHTDATFEHVGTYGYWWSSSEINMGKALLRRIIYAINSIYTDNSFKSLGHSVRCLRDEGLQNTFHLNLELNPLGVGTVSGNGEYEAGEDVNISTYPNHGWEFVNWTDEDDQVISNNMSFVFTMPPVDVTLTANFIDNTGYECGISTITDFDGNVYNTVLVGGRCWMKENLKTTTYNNGTPIPHVTDANDWISLDSGAFSWFNNNSSWGDPYGALYNWYAAVDTNSLCPNGWHVPTLDEWYQMLYFLVDQGYLNQDVYFGAGNALKSCRQINSPLGGDCNTNEHPRWAADDTHIGFDAFDFSALPGGFRSSTGGFALLGLKSQWWNSSEIDLEESWSQGMYYATGTIVSYNSKKITGLSVRCIKDIIPNIYGLNLEVEPSNSGTVSGAGQYEPGEQIFVSAAESEGWLFYNWTDENGIVSHLANFFYTMPYQDVTLTANFVESQSGFTCGASTITDIDGNVYNTVLIGNQCWMKENLKTTRDAAGNNITRFCYDNNTDYCNLYGGLYNWETIMNGQVSSNNNPSGIQGICPAGWHIPSTAELLQLVDYVVAQGYPDEWDDPNGAGNALKSCRQVDSPFGGDCNTTLHPRWSPHSTHSGFDEFGFSAYPGGRFHLGDYFTDLGHRANWWSSTEWAPDFAYTMSLLNYSGVAIVSSNGFMLHGLSVRCLKSEF